MKSFLFLFPLLAVACGSSVQVLERTAQSGAIAIRGSEEGAHGAADRYIRTQCANGYTVTDEHPTDDGWKMTYRCNEARLNTVDEASVHTIVVRF